MACAAAEPFIDPSLSADDIESRALTWLLGGFLAKGVLTGLVGSPGAGKSTGTFASPESPNIFAVSTKTTMLPKTERNGWKLRFPTTIGPNLRVVGLYLN